MNVSFSLMQKAMDTLNINRSTIAAEESKLPIGCSMCANCSGIVGG